MVQRVRPRSRRLVGLLLAVGAVLLAASPTLALRVVDYNILNYPGSSGSARAQHFRTVLSPLQADVIVTQEVNPGGPAQFLNEVLNALEPNQWETLPLIDGNDTDASIFYRLAKVDTVTQWAFYPNQANPLRLVHVFRLRLAGYASPASELRIYTAHLKASTGFEDQRRLECIGLRDSMNAMPAGTHALICGDLNFYKASTEPGYAKLLENQANNIGRVYDLLPAGDWHDSQTFAPYHTQSPCKDGTCASGAANGGLDDRFDFILPTYNLGTAQGMAVIPNTCRAVGNDGLHLNLNITDAPTIPEGAAYATALKLASDHIPLRIDLRLPARITVATDLAFDPVIVGAPTQNRDLSVGNPAVPPADSLNCVFSAPAGFGTPGSLAVAAGGTVPAAISMSAALAGSLSGSLTIVTDAPDAPSVGVALSGTVLRHAAASLDSTVLAQAGTADFGDHEAGGFATQTVRVHNLGFDPLQARLSLSTGVITGSEGRFSLVDGFTGSLIAGTGRDFLLSFDDAGAVVDSTYTATLTFGSSDEPLPGAAPQPDLVVSLRAHVTGGATAVNELPVPTETRLHPAWPNPLAGRTTLQLDLAQASSTHVAIFDASGRRVRTLREGTLGAGRYSLVWDGRDGDGTPVGSGVYFVRFTAAGKSAQSMRLVIVR